ncbi:unnamed protein product, partial [Ectocarpus sp. 8 AP-2014]
IVVHAVVVRPLASHLYKAGTEHAGFSPDQALTSPSAKRREGGVTQYNSDTVIRSSSFLHSSHPDKAGTDHAGQRGGMWGSHNQPWFLCGYVDSSSDGRQ